jgi:hypothetical protein
MSIRAIDDINHKILEYLYFESRYIKYQPEENFLIFHDDFNYKKYRKESIEIRSETDFSRITPDTKVVIVCKDLSLVPLKNTNIKILILESSFNRELNNDLPLTVKHLIIDRSSVFNKFNSLPNTLETLYYENDYDGPLTLPDTLVYLKTGHMFNNDLDTIPDSVQYLDLSETYFNKPIHRISDNLKKLTLSFHFNSTINIRNSNLQSIRLSCWNGDINGLPESLVELNSTRFNQPFDGTLFPNLKWLSLENFTEEFICPPNLDTLIFGEYFNREFQIPSSLTVLMFDQFSIFNKPLNLRDSNLTHVVLNRRFNQPLEIPESLKVIYVPRCYVTERTNTLTPTS